MTCIYIATNIIYILFGTVFCRAWINPVSIYSIVWAAMVALYQLKLVYYYDLTMTTWLIIIIFQAAYNVGCIVGKRRYSNKSDVKKQPDSTITGSAGEEKDLRAVIIILCILCSISVISNLQIAIRAYGFNLLKYTNHLYADRLAGDIEPGIPYFGVCVYPALIYSGIYYKRFGFRKVVLLPIALLLLGTLKSGGRLGIVMGTCLLVFSLIFERNRIAMEGDGKPELKKRQGVNLGMILGISVCLIMFVIITKNRSTWIEHNPYMSPLMLQIVDRNPSTYKNYVYITSPLGVLNEFLKEPTFCFGGHTFLTLYNFLNKFGAKIPVNQYQTFYYTPLRSNVGTFIRELIEDFKIPLALVVTSITGLVFSYNYSRFMKRGSYLNGVWVSTFAFAMLFSFFTWHFRSSSMWITLFVGSIVGYVMDKRCEAR